MVRVFEAVAAAFVEKACSVPQTVGVARHRS